MMTKAVTMISKEKRKELMLEMMPAMMEGIDMNEFMPKMMASMLKNLSADAVVNFLKEALGEKETAKKILTAIQEASLMEMMMFKTYQSQLGFDETVQTLYEQALHIGWGIPDIRDIQLEYQKAGIADMTRMKILYFCNAEGGYSILQDDAHKAMSVMMPMGVSVYEKADDSVEIAGMNLGMMSSLFAGVTREVLANGAKNFEKSLVGIL